jgi:hypothetical protein
MAELEQISMVYDADGGLRGELSYVFGKMRGDAHCALCDITHGAVRKKSDFEALTCSLAVPLEVLHRNEQSQQLSEFTDGILPVVVGHTADGLVVLVDREQMEAADGDVDAFAASLSAAMTKLAA